MTEAQLNTWIQNFEIEVESIQIEFDAFFLNRKIQDYYELKINRQSGYLSIDVFRREDLPAEIIDRLTVAYLNSKPK